MLRLHSLAESEGGWLAVVSSIVEVTPPEDPLGPANTTLLLDDCPLPAKETICSLESVLRLTPTPDWGQTNAGLPPSTGRHQNVAIVLGCLAEKLAGPRAVCLFTKNVLSYLLANLDTSAPAVVTLFSLVALEKFAQTTENKVIIQRAFLAADANQLLRLETLLEVSASDSEKHVQRQVGFCAQWCLDNVFPVENRLDSYRNQNMHDIHAVLNGNDVSEYLKIGPDGLEARCDAVSFESVRCTHQVKGEGRWFYEVTVITAGIMQIGWATRKSKFLNHVSAKWSVLYTALTFRRFSRKVTALATTSSRPPSTAAASSCGTAPTARAWPRVWPGGRLVTSSVVCWRSTARTRAWSSSTTAKRWSPLWPSPFRTQSSPPAPWTMASLRPPASCPTNSASSTSAPSLSSIHPQARR